MPDLPTTPHHENALQHLPDHPASETQSTLLRHPSRPRHRRGAPTQALRTCWPDLKPHQLRGPPTKIHRISSHTNQGEPHSRGGNTQDMLMPSQSTTTP